MGESVILHHNYHGLCRSMSPPRMSRFSMSAGLVPTDAVEICRVTSRPTLAGQVALAVRVMELIVMFGDAARLDWGGLDFGKFQITNSS